MHVSITQWKRFLELSRTTQLRTAIMLNYEQLGPIPQGVRVKVWHALRFDLIEQPGCLGINELVEQCLAEFERENQLPVSPTIKEYFSALLYFSFNALHSEFTLPKLGQVDFDGICQFKQCVKWIYQFCWSSHESLASSLSSTYKNPFLSRIIELFIRETLISSFTKLLSQSPALLITLFDAFFLFGEEMLQKLFQLLLTEFPTIYEEQSNYLELDSGGVLEDMDEVICETYIPEVRKQLYARLTETILVGHVYILLQTKSQVDVCQFNALIFKLQGQLVKEHLTEFQKKKPEQSFFQCTLDEVMQPPVQQCLERTPNSMIQNGSKKNSNRQPSLSNGQSLSQLSNSFRASRVRTSSFASSSSQIIPRTPLKVTNKQTHQRLHSQASIVCVKQVDEVLQSTRGEKTQLIDAIEDIQIFLSQQQHPFSQILSGQDHNQDQMKELRLSLEKLQLFCCGCIATIDNKLPKPKGNALPLQKTTSIHTSAQSRSQIIKTTKKVAQSNSQKRIEEKKCQRMY